MLLLRIFIFSINFHEKRKITPPKYTAITFNLTIYTTHSIWKTVAVLLMYTAELINTNTNVVHVYFAFREIYNTKISLHEENYHFLLNFLLIYSFSCVTFYFARVFLIYVALNEGEKPPSINIYCSVSSGNDNEMWKIVLFCYYYGWGEATGTVHSIVHHRCYSAVRVIFPNFSKFSISFDLTIRERIKGTHGGMGMVHNLHFRLFLSIFLNECQNEKNCEEKQVKFYVFRWKIN